MRHPRKGRRPNREGAGLRGVAAGVNARPTGGREVRGRDREGAAAGGAASAEGQATEPGDCRTARGRGGRERPPYRWAGGKRPGPGERRLRGEGGRGMWVTGTGRARPQGVRRRSRLDRQRGWPLGEGKRPGREGAAAQDVADVCIQNIYFVADKPKRRKETQAKTVWK